MAMSSILQGLGPAEKDSIAGFLDCVSRVGSARPGSPEPLLANYKLQPPPSQDDANKRAEKLRASRQSQAQSISVVGTLVVGVVASGFTWPDLDPKPEESRPEFGVVKVFFYISIVFAIGSVLTALQQAMVLSYIGSMPDEAHNMMKLFVKNGAASLSARYEASQKLLFIWGLPNGLLNSSLYFFSCGLFALVLTLAQSVDFEVGNMATINVIAFIITFFITGVLVTASRIGLYSSFQPKAL